MTNYTSRDYQAADEKAADIERAAKEMRAQQSGDRNREKLSEDTPEGQDFSITGRLARAERELRFIRNLSGDADPAQQIRIEALRLSVDFHGRLYAAMLSQGEMSGELETVRANIKQDFEQFLTWLEGK